jgi:tRNA A-37 threonylcarbamoyl transferase component Bud32
VKPRTSEFGIAPGQRLVVVDGSERRRRRRPTGTPPPLPKKIGTTGKWWLLALAAFLVWMIVLFAVPAVQRVTNRVDSEVLQLFARFRTGWLTDVMMAIDRILTGWTLAIMAVTMIVLLIVFRRWRHLFTFLGAIFVAELIGTIFYEVFARPRPLGVTTIGQWAGYSFPSPPVAVLAMVLVGIAYTLVVPGRARGIAKAVIPIVLGVFILARLYLAVDNPFDILVGLAIAIAIPLCAFRMFTPNELFPVTYRRGKTAHLDVTGKRGEAIVRAVRDQLGMTVEEVKPVGLAGSAGSTPLRLKVGGPDKFVFAKLYSMTHVRADRWYKLGREILYGRLEDEARFQTVLRFVEREDYTLRLLRDVGIPTAAPHGIVEITPGREYMLVTGFIDGAKEIGDADIDDAVIDESLLIIRRLWDAGLAHRDIKPANLLVRGDKVFLIDAFFVQVRPSPWRQAVDLGNMMLALAVRTDAERVYQRALQFFTPDDIAEAMAATRGVASPTQLRIMMKKDGRDLLTEFRSLAPPRPPIALQRWSFRRVGLALLLVAGLFFAAQQSVSMFVSVNDLGPVSEPISRDLGGPGGDCGTGNVMVLMAQSVPPAELLPCIRSLPAGWEVGNVYVKRNRATLSLHSDRDGQMVTAPLKPRDNCDVSGATRVPSDEVGTERYERPEQLPPNLQATRYYLFPGGCVTYDFSFSGDATPSLMFDTDQALAFEPRAVLVEHVREVTGGLELCGAGAPCPGGTGS